MKATDKKSRIRIQIRTKMSRIHNTAVESIGIFECFSKLHQIQEAFEHCMNCRENLIDDVILFHFWALKKLRNITRISEVIRDPQIIETEQILR